MHTIDLTGSLGQSNSTEDISSGEKPKSLMDLVLDHLARVLNETLLTPSGETIDSLVHAVLATTKKLIGSDVSMDREQNSTSLAFFDTATVVTEDILELSGSIYAREGLIRFGDNHSVQQGLDKLKKNGLTQYLLFKMLENSIHDVMLGEVRSVNIYIKNLETVHFREEIEDILHQIPQNKRKGLIFEILEDNYGTIDEQVLSNIRYLQGEGFAIAIDDLYLGANPKGMSKEILATLSKEKICPDYIKIDGRHIVAILNGQFTTDEVKDLKKIIGYFSGLPKVPTVIVEWIQTTDHALLIKEVLGVEGIKMLYQGRNIQLGNFGYSEYSTTTL